MIRRAAADDVEEIVAIFEPSFALLDFLPQLHTHEEHGAVAVEFTDGSGNEEKTPDVRYRWMSSS